MNGHDYFVLPSECSGLLIDFETKNTNANTTFSIINLLFALSSYRRKLEQVNLPDFSRNCLEARRILAQQNPGQSSHVRHQSK